MAVSKLREGIRQDVQPAEQATIEDIARYDLAATALGDSDLLGPAMILLAGRNCSPRCAVSTRAHRLRGS